MVFKKKKSNFDGSDNSSFDGLGGNSFGEDMDRGLGTNNDDSTFTGLGGSSFNDDMEMGLGKKPQSQPKKKSGPRSLLDEWSDAAGSGW
ncbi:uncharacterized protein METZ01_LOCUS388203 [marine metagenome]|uniref:Uncharacterized protein n=1 Tax=marine metagenome TaxID=408172 RepID=A0A382UM69_9ZZZZ|tara:strand:+ start:192 stop:458 length:267 start_codon:yes stop_codon:yes gene_type:complete